MGDKFFDVAAYRAEEHNRCVGVLPVAAHDVAVEQLNPMDRTNALKKMQRAIDPLHT